MPSNFRLVLIQRQFENHQVLGKRKLGVVKFAGKQKFSKLRSFDLPRARKGKLRVVVTKNKPVRIEGVAVVTTKKTG